MALKKFTNINSTRLNVIFKNAPAEKRDLLQGLFKEILFQEQQLELLRSNLEEFGWTDTMVTRDGNEYTKPRGEADVYKNLTVNHMKVVNSLCSLLDDIPKEIETDDEFVTFTKARKSG